MGGPADDDASHELRPTSSRWTHIALRVSDIGATIEWYRRYTDLELLDEREDEDGYGAWLGHRDQKEFPFVLVLAQFFEGRDPFAPTPLAKLAPFNHLGIELPTRDDVDAIAARASAEAVSPCRRRRCPTRSVTSACWRTPTGTSSSSRSIRACTKGCATCGDDGVDPHRRHDAERCDAASRSE